MKLKFLKIELFSYLLVGVEFFFLSGFLIIHLYKDLSSKVEAWYFHSTYVWLIVMALASIVFLFQWKKIKDSSGEEKFKKLPIE